MRVGDDLGEDVRGVEGYREIRHMRLLVEQERS